MAAIEMNRSSVSSMAFGATNFGHAMLNAISEWNDRRVTRKELNKLTDRELDDIGLSRGDVADM